MNVEFIMKKYNTILFDMDGVIADSMHWHAEAWQRVFKEYNIDLPKMEIFIREGMSGLASIVDILKANNHTVPDEDELEGLLSKKLAIFETGKVGIFPHALDILKFVKNRNLKTGLVTGSLRRSVEYILKDDLLPCFDVIVAVDDILNGKPHPEPYLKAMDKLCSKPVEVLVIENAPLGIISAKKAGADCFAIETSLGSHYLQDADRVFKTHLELLIYLKDNL
jgi:beta-phosphoglucomutase